jgi:hypothetical protein
MSSSITALYETQTTANVELLLNQGGSILRGKVREQAVWGTGSKVVNQVGKSTAYSMPARGTKTAQHSTSMTSRHLYPGGVYTTETVTDPDLMQTLANPTSELIQSMANALGEQIDQTIINASIGNSRVGVDGGTTVALPASQITAHGSTGLTIAKLRDMNTKFEIANVNLRTDPIQMIISPQQKNNLLATTQVSSRDYNAVAALVHGEVDMFLGVHFITSNLLPISGTTRTCIAFSKSAITLGVWENLFVKITEMYDQHFETLLYLRQYFGATRTEELKVQSILCTE